LQPAARGAGASAAGGDRRFGGCCSSPLLWQGRFGAAALLPLAPPPQTVGVEGPRLETLMHFCSPRCSDSEISWTRAGASGAEAHSDSSSTKPLAPQNELASQLETASSNTMLPAYTNCGGPQRGGATADVPLYATHLRLHSRP
jgi:hypothetical protein